MYPPANQLRSLAGWPLSAVWLLWAPVASAAPADDQFVVGAGHYNASRWREAADEFRVFLRQFPQDRRTADATFFLGEALVQIGRYAEAEPCYRELLEREPEHRYARQALFRAGETAWLSGQRQQARQALERFVELYPRDPLGGYTIAYLGELALTAGDAPAAQQYYAAALAAFPQGPLVDDCRYGMARSLELAGQLHDAERFYRLLAGTRGALADDAQLRLGIMSHGQGALADAEEFLAAFEVDGGAFAKSELRTSALYWLGAVRIALGRTDEAVLALDLAVEHDRQSPLATEIEFTAADALRMANPAEAAARFERLCEAHPKHELADDALLARLELAATDRNRTRQSLAATQSAQGLATSATAQPADAISVGDENGESVPRLVEQFAAKFPASPLLPLARQAEGRWRLAREEYDLAAAVFEDLTAAKPRDAAAAGSDDAPRLGDPVPLSADPPPQPATRPAVSEAAMAAANWYYLGLARLGQKQHEQALAALEHVDAGAPSSLQDGASVARASALVALGRHEEALPELRDYLLSQPDGPDAARCWAHLAVSLAKVDRLDDAAEAFDELSRRQDSRELLLPTALYLAESAHRARKLDLAQRLFTLLARDGNPEELAAKGRSGLAWLEFEADPQASAERFQQLVLEHPGSSRAAEAALLRARGLEQAGKPQAAIEMYKLVIENHADSPLLADALLGAGKLLDEEELNAEAAELLERYAREFPKSAQLDAALYLWAWALADLERNDEADATFGRLADEHPASAYWGDAVYRLAERAARKQDYPRAKVLAERLIEANVEADVAAHALYLKGQIAAAQEIWAEVEPPLAALLQRHPQTSLGIPARYWIAEAAYRRGQFERAGDLFTDLLVATHERRDAWLGIVPLRLAQVLAHELKWDEAYELAAGIAEKHPDFAQQFEVDYLLGRCLQSRANFDFDAARTAYERVVRSPAGEGTETAAMAQWMIGETYFLQKNFEQALRAYYRVEQLYAYPRWQALALLQAGKCYEVQGQLARAIETYEQLIERFAATTAADEAARRLQVVRERHALLPK
jgi:TolA-binding protein